MPKGGSGMKVIFPTFYQRLKWIRDILIALGLYNPFQIAIFAFECVTLFDVMLIGEKIQNETVHFDLFDITNICLVWK